MNRALAVLAFTLLVAAPAAAHEFTITKTDLLLRRDGTFQVDLIADLDALALGRPQTDPNDLLAATLRSMPPEELAATRERLADYFVRYTRIRFDGASKLRPTVEFPEFDPGGEQKREIPSVFGVTARLVGEVPAEAKTVTFGASRTFQAVHLTVHREGEPGVVVHVVGIGDDSPSVPLAGERQSALAVAVEYTRLGFEHILPRGVDHILFVLSLFLLSPRLKPLLWQVTAFTLAHTITLALSVLGVVELSSRIVEPLIALSIALVAIENVATTKLHAWRPAIVFVFGLLHGLGFAGVLRDLGLPQGQLVAALVSFNVGVELGQLAVIGLAALAIGWFRRERWYRMRVTAPISVLIAAIGAYTAVQRAFLPETLPALI